MSCAVHVGPDLLILVLVACSVVLHQTFSLPRFTDLRPVEKHFSLSCFRAEHYTNLLGVNTAKVIKKLVIA